MSKVKLTLVEPRYNFKENGRIEIDSDSITKIDSFGFFSYKGQTYYTRINLTDGKMVYAWNANDMIKYQGDEDVKQELIMYMRNYKIDKIL